MSNDVGDKKAIGTLTVFVIVVFITAIAFTVTALWFNWHGCQIQDSVATGFYSLFGAEFGITGGIQVVKTIHSWMVNRKNSDGGEEDE